jgi:PAS domain S-box-containing protein
MKIRFTIARKLLVGFGIVTMAVIISSSLTFLTLQKNKQINEEVSKTLSPSENYLNELTALVVNSKMLIKNWVFIERKNDTPDKIKLRKLHNESFPDLEEKILVLEKSWSTNDQKEINNLLSAINDTLFEYHRTIMDQLSSFEAYDDVMIVFEVNPMVQEDGEVISYTDNIIERLENLTSKFTKLTTEKNEEMFSSLDKFQNFIILMGVILIITALIIGFVTMRQIVSPINYLKEFLLMMTKGILPKEKMIVTNDEIGDMSEALNTFVDALRNTSEFSLEIGKGNFNMDFKPLSNKDILGNSLLDMRDNLKKAEKDEEGRKHDDELRNWTSSGLAKFSEILRKNNDNIEELSFDITSNVLEYLDAIQGAIFIINDTDPDDVHFELKSAIAYNRKKFINKKVSIGEGLVGRCAFEQLTIYLKEIPEEYVSITSGLGTSNPNTILVVPLRLNEEVFGVIELASFNEFLPHQIEFVEKLGENIASTISAVKINERTARLLAESRQKGEELAAQEEEMRQNMEELQATQEESARKEMEMRDTIDAINHIAGNVSLSLDGTITAANNQYAEILSMSNNELIGTKLSALISFENETDKDDYIESWNNLSSGISFDRESKYKTGEKEIWLKESYSPFKNTEGDYDKVVMLVTDITRTIELEKKLSEK